MKVKSFLPSFAIFCFCLSMTSCVVTKHGHKPPPPPPHHHHKMPPGHAKKVHGEKSAKYYAPGHHKK